MIKLNDEIIGGLISALSRGESLEKAMMTFYNAGYEKEEIEDSAKDVYNKVGSQVMGIKGSLQETLDEIALKAGVKKKEGSEKESGKTLSEEEKLVLQPIPDKKEMEEELKKVNQTPTVKQDVSAYGTGSLDSPKYNNDDITNKIQEAIKGLRPVNIPSKIEIVHKNEESRSPTIVQHVSSYDDSISSPNKAVTYILIFVLLLLIGALVAVFLFKDDLIKLFNELGLG